MAHGTRNPAGVDSVWQIIDALRTSAPAAEVRAAFVELVDPSVPAALAERLAEAGLRPGDAVVLAGAGSSDPDAVASVRMQADLLAAELAARTG
ncbi:MAG TPA: CbiX/SirB N-terminal domain-containing protein, partial [Mycobacteriales bacterium]|nr:CbiX/SirB N-terminal domain-containing protein [Mycobacteriales bacterium]